MIYQYCKNLSITFLEGSGKAKRAKHIIIYVAKLRRCEVCLHAWEFHTMAAKKSCHISPYYRVKKVLEV